MVYDRCKKLTDEKVRRMEKCIKSVPGVIATVVHL